MRTRLLLPLLTSLGVILCAPCARAVTYIGALLNSTGYSGESAAYAASGPSRVGSAHRGTDVHALLWDSTNSVAVDLNPDQFGSEALGVWGSTQVGTIFGQTTQ